MAKPNGNQKTTFQVIDKNLELQLKNVLRRVARGELELTEELLKPFEKHLSVEQQDYLLSQWWQELQDLRAEAEKEREEEQKSKGLGILLPIIIIIILYNIIF